MQLACCTFPIRSIEARTEVVRENPVDRARIVTVQGDFLPVSADEEQRLLAASTTRIVRGERLDCDVVISVSAGDNTVIDALDDDPCCRGLRLASLHP